MEAWVTSGPVTEATSSFQAPNAVSMSRPSDLQGDLHFKAVREAFEFRSLGLGSFGAPTGFFPSMAFAQPNAKGRVPWGGHFWATHTLWCVTLCNTERKTISPFYRPIA